MHFQSKNSQLKARFKMILPLDLMILFGNLWSNA